MDDEGVFPYIRIIITEKLTGRSKQIVRGFWDVEPIENYKGEEDIHLGVLKKFTNEELSKIPTEFVRENWYIECPGGGKIKHYNEKGNNDKRILIFGNYEETKHITAREIIKKDYWGYRFKESWIYSLDYKEWHYAW